MDKQKVAASTQRMQAHQESKNQTQQILQDAAKNYANKKFGPSITEEQIKKAFAIIDSHTKFLDNLTILNNLNMTVNVISTILVTNSNWNESKETCKSLVRDYMNVFIDIEKTIEGDELQTAIRDYIVSSCMIYYAVSKKDRAMLVEYNSKVSDDILTILKLATQPSTKHNIVQIPKKEETKQDIQEIGDVEVQS